MFESLRVALRAVLKWIAAKVAAYIAYATIIIITGIIHFFESNLFNESIVPGQKSDDLFTNWFDSVLEFNSLTQ